MKGAGWIFFVGALLTACGAKEVERAEPIAIEPAAACALDGMLLAYHEGPKAQLVRKNGERAYFCDSKEVFDELLDPVRRRQVAGLWFQALDDAPWEAHADGWADAEKLFFVAGSSKMGAMGPTLAPFVARQRAEAFVGEYGGRIYRFAEIDATLMGQLRTQGMAQLEE